MLLSKNLLNELFPVFKKVNSEKLEKMLNSIGIEVESIFKFENTDNLIVGQILDVKKHPDSQKLNICKVFFENKTHTIICGANNVRKDLKVIVAKVGTKMLDGRIIEAKDLLGVKSEGMICAYNELTARINYCSNDEIEEIIELDSNAKINDYNPLRYIGFDDEIYDLSIPSNRNELNGIIGIVYDLIPLYFTKIKLNYDFENIKNCKKTDFKIAIDKNLCSFFGIIDVENISLQKSDWKIKSWLINSGVIPINLAVDLTNLNTIITSCPSHGYDKSQLNNELVVKIKTEKSQFFALNKKEYQLEAKEAIYVTSKDEIVSLAGIIGMQKSSINNQTKNIIYEVGNFNNLLIRKVSEKINLKTLSSILSSKKIPLWISYKSFDFLIGLIKKMHFKIRGISYISKNLREKIIPYNEIEIMELLGLDFKKGRISTILKSMDFKIKSSKIIPPIYREDIDNIFDIVEELTKKINVNELPEKPIDNSIVDFQFDYFEETRYFLENYFIDKGFTLVKTLNLCSNENNEQFNLFNTKKSIKLINPISKERESFRNNLIAQHLEVLANNFSYKNSLLNIFELQGLNYDDSWNQHLCVTLAVNHFHNKINNSQIKLDLLFLKSILTDLFSIFNLDYGFRKIEHLNPRIDFILLNNGFEIYINEKLKGFASQINPEILKNLKIVSDIPIYFFELIANDLLLSKNTKQIFVKDEKKQHDIKRLLTVIVDKEDEFVKYNNIFKVYEKDLSLIQNVNVESLYFKENKTSYTFSFEINQNSLVKKDSTNINMIVEKLINDLEKIGAEIKK